MLTRYQTDTRNLLQSPSAPTTLYDVTNLNLWINKARSQVAGEAECVRVLSTISTTVGLRGGYPFSSIDTGVSATNGIAGPLHVRAIRYAVGDGFQWVRPRNWEWFDLYKMNNPVPGSGPPEVWSQYGQGAIPISGGAGQGGRFFIDPIPDIIYVLTCDCVCFPIDLVNDATVEAIPFMWTEAVSFLAAYFALMSAQTGARYGDAERLYQHYETFMERARKQANPSVNRYLYSQALDPTLTNKLGLQPKAAGTG